MGRATSFGNEGTIECAGYLRRWASWASIRPLPTSAAAGTLNVGTEAGKADGTNGTGLVGIKGTNTANQIYNNTTGVSNVYANNSYAFGGNGKVVNNGTVTSSAAPTMRYSGTGAAAITGSDKAIVAQHHSALAGYRAHAGELQAPRAWCCAATRSAPNANGTAGTLRGSHLDVSEVKVDTAFAAGTAAKAVTFDNVFQGSDITGARAFSPTAPSGPPTRPRTPRAST